MMIPQANYVVVEVPSDQNVSIRELRAGTSDLLPWADPYIAMLIQKHERAMTLGSTLIAEASPPIGESYPPTRSSRRRSWRG